MTPWLRAVVFAFCTVTTIVFAALVVSLIIEWSPWAFGGLVAFAMIAFIRYSMYEEE